MTGRLRVGLDVSPLALTRAGAARYIESLLEALPPDAVEVRRYGFGSSSRALVPVRDVGWYLAALPLRGGSTEWTSCIARPTARPFGRRCRSSSRSTTSPCAAPRALQPLDPRIQPRRAAAGRTGGARLIAASEFTRQELLELLDVPDEKIRVIPHAVGAPFVADGDAAFGDYVLTVGRSSRARTSTGLVDGFERAGLNGSRLLVAGMRGWGGVDVSGDRVQQLGFVPDDELARLYRGARCVAYLSAYEGFGLPLVEAMACGAPVVAANAGSAPEVTGGGRAAVDPTDPDAIAAGLAEAIDRHEELRALGLERAKAFSVDAVARATVDVYREAAA